MADKAKAGGFGRGIAQKALCVVIGIALGVALTAAFSLGRCQGTPTTASTSPSVVFDRIVSKDELVTVAQDYNITDKVSSTSTFFDWFDLPFTTNSFWYRYTGTIKAGVNLEDAAMETSGSIIRITLSQPYIISNTPNMDESGVLEETNNILNPIHVENVDQFQRECVETSEAKAIEGGLLEEAKANAEIDLRDLFNAGLGDAYTIEFAWRE